MGGGIFQLGVTHNGKKRMERGVEFSIDCLPLEIVREAFSLVIIVPSLYQN